MNGPLRQAVERLTNDVELRRVGPQLRQDISLVLAALAHPLAGGAETDREWVTSGEIQQLLSELAGGLAALGFDAVASQLLGTVVKIQRAHPLLGGDLGSDPEDLSRSASGEEG